MAKIPDIVDDIVDAPAVNGVAFHLLRLAQINNKVLVLLRIDFIADQIAAFFAGIVCVDHTVSQLEASGITVIFILTDPVAGSRNLVAFSFRQVAGGTGRTTALLRRSGYRYTAEHT